MPSGSGRRPPLSVNRRVPVSAQHDRKNIFFSCVHLLGSKMRAAILKKTLEGPNRPDSFKFQEFAQGKSSHNRAIQVVGGRHVHNRDYAALAGNLVHAQNLEIGLGGFALFDFQIPYLFKTESAFDVPAHLHVEKHVSLLAKARVSEDACSKNSWSVLFVEFQ